jgi:galactose mutarotase-like enzyme
MDALGVATKEENVLIQAGDCSVTFLPRLGAKIASIRVKGKELMQGPIAPLEPRTRTLAFDKADASGWDECLPSVSPCTVETAAGPVEVPDHGDLWRVAWQASGVSSTCATFRGECFSLPLTLERTATLTKEGKGWQLRVDYKVTNTGSHPAPWLWCAHPLFASEAGDRIVLPDSIHELRVGSSGDTRLGHAVDRVEWPVAKLANGKTIDLSLGQSPESGVGDKLYAGPLAASEGWCALERPRAGVRIRVRFHPAVTPYLGLWICYGGWPDGPGPKENCVALEPATAPTDSLAHTGPWSRVLAAGASFSWPMIVEFELI